MNWLGAKLALILVLIGVLVFFTQFRKSSYLNIDSNFSPSISAVTQLFSQDDPEVAYTKLLQVSSGWSLQDKHLLGHYVGEVLFSQFGLKGLDYCTSDFSFGCYHSFFSKAVAEMGVEVIPDLGEACGYASNVGCQHGIGHGLGEYFGPEEVEQQLSYCQDLPWKEPVLGCSSGVFMEYNWPLSFENDQLVVSLRPLSEENTFHPCDQIGDTYLRSCYFEQASWWYSVYDQDQHMVADLCESLDNNQLTTDCLRGLGQAIMNQHQLDLDLAYTKCDSLGGAVRAKCRGGIGWVLYSTVETRSQALEPCEVLKKGQKEVCIDTADILHEFGTVGLL